MNIQLSELKQSEDILEIRRVNPVFVSRYRQSMREGDQFPPMLIDQHKTIISGNHRYEAYLAEFGDDHTVKVVQKTYKNDADRIEDAIRENARHGNPLDGISRKRAIQKLIDLGREPEAVGKLLGVSVSQIKKISDLYVVVRGNGKKPVKRGLEHLAGKTMTKKQYEDHDKKDRAMNVYQQCEQLVRWLDAGHVNLEEPRNVEALQKLAEKIDENLA